MAGGSATGLRMIAAGRPRTASGLGVLAALVVVAAPSPAGAAWFEKRPHGLASWYMVDLGVSDHDRDGRLDLFTSNHRLESSLLDGATGNDVQGALGLAPTPAFPGFDHRELPVPVDPGLYVYADGPALHLRSFELGAAPDVSDATVAGTVRFPFRPVKIVEQGAAEATASDATVAGLPGTEIEFELGADGDLLLDPPFLDAPIELAVAPDFPAARIRVGALALPAAQHQLELTLRDRHGVGWADYDGDGRRDAFISRGGYKGRLSRYPGLVVHELLVQRPGGSYLNEIGAAGIVGDRCRGRHALPADYDRDGDVDLLMGCEGRGPRLYRQTSTGGFEDDSRALRRLAGPAPVYRWADLFGGRGLELLVARDRSILVLGFRRGRWKRLDRSRLRGSLTSLRGNLGTADLDNDGDLDVHAAAGRKSTLLVNEGRRLRPVSPRRRELPARGFWAVAVDADNDGRQDLHVLPAGLYLQRRDGSFRRTGRLETRRRASWALAIWADLDNDGAREPVTSIRRDGRSRTVRAYRNTRPRRWLQVDLAAAAPNTDAIGASVTIRYGSRRQTQWVGQNDSSRWSFGHYRLYFGVNRRRLVRSLTVRWPDGSNTHLHGIATNRLLEISQPGVESRR